MKYNMLHEKIEKQTEKLKGTGGGVKQCHYM